MLNFIIKTHRQDTTYNHPHLYILNKGLNAGKPLKDPCPNCFVIIMKNEEEVESAYLLTYALWKSNFWNYYLVGSVIPFLRITDFKTCYFSKINQILLDQEQHHKDIQYLKILHQKETQMQKNIKLINDVKETILYRYSMY
jgi:hypothetical protein